MTFPMKKILGFLVALQFIPFVLSALVGIDYGQQNIKAMVVSPRAPLEIVLTPEAKRKDTNGLAFKKLGGLKSKDFERVYGSAVGSLATRFPKNTFLHLKPLLGKPLSGKEDAVYIKEYLREHPGVNITATDRNTVAFEIFGTEYPIEELVAMNLEEIVGRANSLIREREHTTRDPVDLIALTVPDFYDQFQRQALVDTVSLLSGNFGVQLISDGLSIAINYALKQRDFEPNNPHSFLIYDMGSGSTKASLFTIEQPEDKTEPLRIELRGYAYNDTLGGAQFTLKVSDLICEKFLKANPRIKRTELLKDSRAIAKVNQAAEKVKLVLSANSEAHVNIESLISDIDFRTTITREEFEQALGDDVEAAVRDSVLQPFMEQFAVDYRPLLKKDEIFGVILAGGSTRVPFVQNILASIFTEEKVLKSINADESAVNGATVRGVKLFETFKTKPLNITERSVFAYSMGLDMQSSGGSGGEIRTIFAKGDVFPARKSILVPVSDVSVKHNLSLFENDHLVANVSIDPVSGLAKEQCLTGTYIYNITFDLSQMRMLTIESLGVSCAEAEGDKITKGEGKKRDTAPVVSPRFSVNSVSIKTLDNTEKLEYINRIKDLNERDKLRFQLQEAKNLLEATLYDARNFLSESDVIENGPPRQLEKMTAMVDEYLEWLEFESDDATKADVNRRKKEITALKSRIELYIKAVGEPLDLEQFKNILTKADQFLEEVKGHAKVLEEKIVDLEGLISEKYFSVRDEFSKVKLPSSLSRQVSGFNKTLDTFREAVQNVTKLVKSKTFGDIPREDLFEVKSGFEKLFEKAYSKFEQLKSSEKYRINELKSLYQRKLRVEKRKEQKLSKSLRKEEEEEAELTLSRNITSGAESGGASTTKLSHDEL